MLNSGQNTVLLAKLCRKTKRVLIGAQTTPSLTVKFHARRMRGTRFVQTIGCLLKPVGARCARPSKHPLIANPTATRKRSSFRGSFRGGSSAAGGEGVPFPNAKLHFPWIRTHTMRPYDGEGRKALVCADFGLLIHLENAEGFFRPPFPAGEGFGFAPVPKPNQPCRDRRSHCGFGHITALKAIQAFIHSRAVASLPRRSGIHNEFVL